MTLEEFVKNFVRPNSLIRLWTPIKGGHKMIYKYNINLEYKDIDIDVVCMEWELLRDRTWHSKYKNKKVLGVKDILLDDFYRESINIVIEE